MSDLQTKNNTQYFATQSPRDLAAAALERVLTYDQYLSSSGRIDVWARSYSFYNQGIYKDARLNRVGEQGEYTETFVNQFRNILLHILNMTTGQPPEFDARASNTDFNSMAQTKVANSILDYYNRVKGMGTVGRTAVEDCLQFADGYVYQGWDFSLGDPFMPDPKDPTGTKRIKQGDVLQKNFHPMDVIFDHMGGLRDAGRQWYILRDFQNKWDLAARYPEMRDKIIRYADDSDMWKYRRIGTRGNSPDDTVPIFLLLHDRTDAVPNGRMFSFIGQDCWLFDADLPPWHKRLPVYRLCASKQRGSGFGYSVAFDLCPIQETINSLYSIIATNHASFGVQNIAMPSGSNIGVTELMDGLNCITYDPKLGKPEVLNLINTPREIFDHIQKLETVMETISGVNATERGTPPPELSSGSALALIQSMAIQFNSGLEQSYVAFMEDLATGLIDILKDRATTQRMIEISGKANQTYMQAFTQKDISSINRVTVDLGNPVARTTAGKVNIAENLLKAGLVEDAAQYIQVLTTGNLEPLIEGKQAELMNIRMENEMLSAGQPPQAIGIDNHPLHVMEHKAVLASPEARKNGSVVQAVLAHVQQHIDLWKQTDPDLMDMIGEKPPPVPGLPAPGPAGPQAKGAPGPRGGRSPEPKSNSPETAPGNPVVRKASTVRHPVMPKNPLTGERAQPNGGQR